MADVTHRGWLTRVRCIESPNFDERPADCTVDMIVIHGISLPPGEYGGGGVEALFTNTLSPDGHLCYAEIYQLRVSTHLFIRRDGELVQFVSLDQRAWHAGESCYEGRSRCNDFSIGIELEGVDDSAYANVQYQVLVNIIRTLMRRYPAISEQRIVGHCDIAPGRKKDPGAAFDWLLLHRLLSASYV